MPKTSTFAGSIPSSANPRSVSNELIRSAGVIGATEVIRYSAGIRFEDVSYRDHSCKTADANRCEILEKQYKMFLGCASVLEATLLQLGAERYFDAGEGAKAV